MRKQLSINIIKERIKQIHGDVIHIDESTYIDAKSKSTFIDKDYGIWEAYVNKIIRGAKHPLRAIKEKAKFDGVKNKLTLDEINKRIYDMWGDTVRLIGTYKGIKTKTEFMDKDYGIFINNVEHVLRHQGHKDRHIRSSNSKKLMENGLTRDIEGFTLKDIWRDYLRDKVTYNHLCKLSRHYCSNTIKDTINLINNGLTDIENSLSSHPLLTRFNRYPFKDAHFRPDFKVNDNLFVNVDGLYWHSDKVLDKKYHFNMRQKSKNANIKLLQFRADEIMFKKDIVYSMINVKANKCKKIFARKTNILEIDTRTAVDFLNRTHLMGSSHASKYIALTYLGTIVSLMSISIKGTTCKIERFSSELNTSVSGGYSKVLNYIKKNYNINKIITFVDLRYGTVDSLVNMDFKHVSTTLGWKWTDYVRTYNRLYCKANMDDRKLSEKEHAKELKLVKIYDAGQAKLIWNKNE